MEPNLTLAPGLCCNRDGMPRGKHLIAGAPARCPGGMWTCTDHDYIVTAKQSFWSEGLGAAWGRASMPPC